MHKHMNTTNSAFRIPQSAIRNGISLLEVLMSIFIITIGVLGVATLLPLATHLASRGTMADRAAISGRNALHTFSVREMNNPERWLKADGTTDAAFVSGALDPTGAKAYCLDPRLIAREPGATVFPTGGTPSMQRITLKQSPTTATAMNTLLADEAFTLQDDLHFTVPDDDVSPPVQRMFTGNEKRLTDGEFSWLATLVREGPGDRYTLSAVVFIKRNTPAAAQEINIPAANVTMYGGIGGGELTLNLAAAGLSAAQLITANESLVGGNWVMLSSGSVFRWYRILYVSEFDGTQRNITVAGRDWSAGNPQVTIIPGAIAAYERTVRLETSSLWQP